MDKIVEILKQNADEGYKAFNAKLVPTIDSDRIIGVRVPVIRKLAKQCIKGELGVSAQELISELPHFYYDEYIFHALVISEEKDFERAVALTNSLLPYIDNWAVCDILSPKVFGKHKDKLFEIVRNWLASDKIYTVRFGINMMIKYFLDGHFKKEQLELVLNADRDEYYVSMAVAWYLSVAFVKQYDVTLEFMKSHKIAPPTLRRAVQKARDSFRLSAEQKLELGALIKHE